MVDSVEVLSMSSKVIGIWGAGHCRMGDTWVKEKYETPTAMQRDRHYRLSNSNTSPEGQ